MQFPVVVFLAVFGIVQLATATLIPPEPTVADLDDVQVRLHIANGGYFYDLDRADRVLKNKHFNPELKTVIFIHDFQESGESESVERIGEAYLANGEYNVVSLDWGALAGGSYRDASANMMLVGSQFADVLATLFDDGLPVEKVHLVGHALGAQMAGVVGRGLKVKNVEVKRITGLDPSVFWYVEEVPELFKLLSRDDAEFVDVIHTDRVSGVRTACGDADFWPNPAREIQPGCTYDEIECSLKRAWEFWAESVEDAHDPDTFLAVEVNNKLYFELGLFNKANTVQMGLNCPETAHGKYFLTTEGTSPYSKGAAGTKAPFFRH